MATFKKIYNGIELSDCALYEYLLTAKGFCCEKGWQWEDLDTLEIKTGRQWLKYWEENGAPEGCECTAPEFTSPIVITPGDPCWGTKIFSSEPEYVGTEPITVSYQWYRDEDPIPGETGNQYNSQYIDAGTDITLRVTLTNACGEVVTTSNVVWDLQSVPTNIGAPIIAAPSTNIGDPITVTSPGVWANGTATYTYQWYRGGIAIPLATSSTYNITADDFGKRITCNVTDSNDCGQSLPSTSNTIIIPIP